MVSIIRVPVISSYHIIHVISRLQAAAKAWRRHLHITPIPPHWSLGPTPTPTSPYDDVPFIDTPINNNNALVTAHLACRTLHLSL